MTQATLKLMDPSPYLCAKVTWQEESEEKERKKERSSWLVFGEDGD